MARLSVVNFDLIRYYRSLKLGLIYTKKWYILRGLGGTWEHTQVWQVEFSTKARKQIKQLPETIRLILQVLVEEIKKDGPFRATWKNYSKLGPDQYHCHLKKGQPTYVVCWQVINKKVKVAEVYYVGTHEKAPY